VQDKSLNPFIPCFIVYKTRRKNQAFVYRDSEIFLKAKKITPTSSGKVFFQKKKPSIFFALIAIDSCRAMLLIYRLPNTFIGYFLLPFPINISLGFLCVALPKRVD